LRVAASAPQTLTTAQNSPAVGSAATAREALSYTVPASSPETAAAIAPARLTNYVFAHSKYSSGLAQRGVLADLLIEDDGLQLPPPAAPQPSASPDVHDAP
jgi:hypothetical protein